MYSFVQRVPDGDERERMVCADCGYVAYENPKIVVGSVVAIGDRVLMCRRAIEPRQGFWTLPAGYMELGETLEEGAIREAREEAEAIITIHGILGIYDLARTGQVQIIFLAGFTDPVDPAFGPGLESLEVQLFQWDEIPWDEVAFPSVGWALNAWRATGPALLAARAGDPPDNKPGIYGLLSRPTGGSP